MGNKHNNSNKACIRHQYGRIGFKQGTPFPITDEKLAKIDELIKLHNKKALIIPSFDNSLQGYKFNNATVVNLNLNQDVKNRSLEKNNLLKVDNLDRVNHMFKKENTVLAQAVADYILNQDSSNEINFKKYFKYLDN